MRDENTIESINSDQLVTATDYLVITGRPRRRIARGSQLEMTSLFREPHARTEIVKRPAPKPALPVWAFALVSPLLAVGLFIGYTWPL